MHQHLKNDQYLRAARALLFDAVRPLTPDQYNQPFPIGPGSIRAILHHCLLSEWYYTARLEQKPLPPYEQWPLKDESPLDFPTLETTWASQAERTTDALSAVQNWHDTLSYTVHNDDGHSISVTCTASDLATQRVLHETYHRAQIANILKHTGITTPDLDYNAIMYTRSDKPA